MYRWFAAALLVSAIGISGFYRHRARLAGEVIARRRESGPLILGRVVVAVPLWLSVLIWIAHPAWMAWAAFDAPDWLRNTGVVLGALAIPLAWWVFSTLGHNVSETVLTKQDHALVTTGPYHWVRHPLYLTGLTAFTSIGLMAANRFVLLMTLVALAGVLAVVIPREEAALIEKFGDAYTTYRARTGRLLPRLSAIGR